MFHRIQIGNSHSYEPFFYLVGKMDGVVPYSGSENLKECIPHVELLTIEEGTHDITYRQPTEVGEAINKFLLSNRQ